MADEFAAWRVIDNPPVCFRRAAGVKPLPMPLPGGSVETLRAFLNLKSDADFVLVVAWLVKLLHEWKRTAEERARGRKARSR
jgi:hypothetical protein